jgi:dTDP-3-amino-3,4,6-trideoxy-alpha-D-glucose transaminase
VSPAPSIAFLDSDWQNRQVRAETLAALDALTADPSCDGAPFVKALEAAVAEYHGGGFHAIGAQSGTTAEFLLLRAWGIGSGDEVVTVPNSDLSTTSAISHAGARFVFVDVGEDHQMDPNRVEAAITPAARAILCVHMHGAPAPVEELADVARRHGVLLLEDATIAIGARHRGALVGTFGDGAVFSFGARKVIGGLGSGGMVLVRDPDVADRLRLLRGYGLSDGDAPMAERAARTGQNHVVEGHNLKLDGLDAAVTIAKLRHLDAWRELRARTAARYDTLLAGVPGLVLPSVPPGDVPAWREYTLLADDRDGLRAHLREEGIGTGVHYAPPVHRQPVYASLGLGPGSFPVAERLASRLLNLPCGPGLGEETQARVAAAVRAFQERSAA